MSAQEQHQDFLMLQIKALQTENERLNNELRKVKDCAFKVRLSDPNFDKPLSEIETKFCNRRTFKKIIMLTIAIIFITVLFAFVVALMIILIEVIEKNDKLRKDRDQLNELNDGLCKENLELMDKLLEAGI